MILVGNPQPARASFFSDLVTKVVGSKAQADTQAVPVSSSSINNISNSQTTPLPETSINPDLIGANQSTNSPAVITDGAAVASDGSLDAGTDAAVGSYDSTAKINVYTVKKGDTIETIAKQLKISQKSLLASNPDVQKGDSLKPGQVLTFLPGVKTIDKTTNTTNSPAVPTPKDTTTKKQNPPSVSQATPTPQIQPPQPQTPLVSPSVNIQTETNITPTITAPLDTSTAPATPITNPSSSSSDDTTTADQQPGTSHGDYIWPFTPGVGRISQGLHADEAYDFAAPLGTPIHAVQSGTILVTHTSGWNGGFGLYVVENFDDGRQAIYGHMSKVIAVSGQVVHKGDVIGLVGSTGDSTGPHVHIGFHGSQGNPYYESGIRVNDTSSDIHD